MVHRFFVLQDLHTPVQSPAKDAVDMLQTDLSECQNRVTQLEFQLDQALEENAVLKHSAEKVPVCVAS